MFDLNGEWGWKKAIRKVGGHFKRHWKTYATVASFAVPGIGGVAWAYRGYRAYKVIRTVRASRGASWGTRAVSRGVAKRAGRMWTRGNRKSFRTSSGHRGSFSGRTGRQYRPPKPHYERGGRHYANFNQRGNRQFNYHLPVRSRRWWR